jgi:hypothetical protein
VKQPSKANHYLLSAVIALNMEPVDGPQPRKTAACVSVFLAFVARSEQKGHVVFRSLTDLVADTGGLTKPTIAKAIEWLVANGYLEPKETTRKGVVEYVVRMPSRIEDLEYDRDQHAQAMREKDKKEKRADRQRRNVGKNSFTPSHENLSPHVEERREKILQDVGKNSFPDTVKHNHSVGNPPPSGEEDYPDTKDIVGVEPNDNLTPESNRKLDALLGRVQDDDLDLFHRISEFRHSGNLTDRDVDALMKAEARRFLDTVSLRNIFRSRA